MGLSKDLVLVLRSVPFSLLWYVSTSPSSYIGLAAEFGAAAKGFRTFQGQEDGAIYRVPPLTGMRPDSPTSQRAPSLHGVSSTRRCSKRTAGHTERLGPIRTSTASGGCPDPPVKRPTRGRKSFRCSSGARGSATPQGRRNKMHTSSRTS